MERSFLAAQSSGDHRSWLPLPSTVELWGFPRIGSRASSSVAQLNSVSSGKRSWFELCAAMGRGETQPREESSPLLPPPPEARGSRDGSCHFWATTTLLHWVLEQKPWSPTPGECEYHAAAGAACLAFQVSDPPTAVCEDVPLSLCVLTFQQQCSLQGISPITPEASCHVSLNGLLMDCYQVG